MTPLVTNILFEALDLLLRMADTPEDVEKYIELRTKLRKQLVEEAKNGIPNGVDPAAWAAGKDGDVVAVDNEETSIEAEESRNGTPTPTSPSRPDSPGTSARSE